MYKAKLVKTLRGSIFISSIIKARLVLKPKLSTNLNEVGAMLRNPDLKHCNQVCCYILCL